MLGLVLVIPSSVQNSLVFVSSTYIPRIVPGQRSSSGSVGGWGRSSFGLGSPLVRVPIPQENVVVVLLGRQSTQDISESSSLGGKPFQPYRSPATTTKAHPRLALSKGYQRAALITKEEVTLIQRIANQSQALTDAILEAVRCLVVEIEPS